MCPMFEVGVACEGPTDLVLLRAILAQYIDDFVIRPLQPQGSLYGGDNGPHGGGWKGVRGWCRAVARAGGLEAVNALPAEVGLLIIHVDADLAGDGEIDVARPCPPVTPTVDAVERVVMAWLDLAAIPSRVVLCVPSKASEAWLLRALWPSDPASVACASDRRGGECVECHADPARLLAGRRPRLVRFKQGDLRKVKAEYEAQAARFAACWADVVAHCASACRFDARLRAVLGVCGG